MPTKRRRVPRPLHSQALTPSELQWLTGEAQPRANRFWIHSRGAAKVARCEVLLLAFAALIPPDRLPILQGDLERWRA